MNFNSLKQDIKTISDSFRQNAMAAVNIHLTVRNWLIGFYIVEYEQNGEDRAKYGSILELPTKEQLIRFVNEEFSKM